MTLVLFLVGLVLLVVGAEALIRGSSNIALRAGISPLVVGLTVVAFGTSSPELAVSVSAARAGEADLAIGNVVGSNIFNVLLILGLCALVKPLLIVIRLVRVEVPIMIGVSALLWLLVSDGELERWQAALLGLGLVTYLVWTIRSARREGSAHDVDLPGVDESGALRPWYVNAGYILLGLAALVVGSTWLVDGAVEFATRLGLSELVIGLTIVAAGTSLPELATSLLATYRGEREIAVGNVVGSNIFNVLGVLGISGTVAAEPLIANAFVRTVDLPVMLLVAAVCLPVFFSGQSLLHRWEGALFLAGYVLYIVYLVWSATDDGVPGWYVDLVRFVLVPVAVVVVLAVAWLDLERRAGVAGKRDR